VLQHLGRITGKLTVVGNTGVGEAKSWSAAALLVPLEALGLRLVVVERVVGMDASSLANTDEPRTRSAHAAARASWNLPRVDAAATRECFSRTSSFTDKRFSMRSDGFWSVGRTPR
jgi:hypothetical protein